MAVAAVSQAGVRWRSSVPGSPSLGVCGKPSPCCSRQQFPFPDVAMSLWPKGVHSVAKASRQQLRGACRCQAKDEPEKSEEGNVADEDTLLQMKSVSTRKLEEYIDMCKGQSVSSSCEDENWRSWQEYFPKVEEEDNLISALKFQLEEAVKSENFQEAAKLKKTIEAAKANDVILEINNELQRALEEERYSDAARLRDQAGAGLVGWWAGLSKSGNDPFGRIINVKAAHGRLIARNYTARQLAYAAQRAAQGVARKTRQKVPQGNALFEVFVKKDDKGFNRQVVYLQRDTSAQEAATAELDKLVNLETGEISEPEKKADVKKSDEKDKEEKKEKSPKDDSDKDEYQEANEIVDFLKERIPDFKMKVIKVTAPEGSEPDIPKIIEEIIQKEEEQRPGEGDPIIGGVVIEDTTAQADLEGKPAGEDKEVTIKVVIGGASPVDGANGLSAVRVPATISQETKDSFVLHIDSIPETKEADFVKIATAAARTSAEQMPEDVAKKMWNAEKLPVQASKELKDVIKLAVAQAQGTRTLPKTTVFHRIDTECADPFTGLYVGTFGANIPEIIQLKRKYGHWDTQKTQAEDKLKFYQYVEAVKLTGDMNVPAGQVSFRARIGKEYKQSPVGVYPEELGVVARYKGQGQLADPGFKNPKWTDGELVLLDGRKTGPAGGAKLGFVFYLPDHHFLILFDRLNLEEICRG